jgi:hypothetical protein
LSTITIVVIFYEIGIRTGLSDFLPGDRSQRRNPVSVRNRVSKVNTLTPWVSRIELSQKWQ